MVALGLIISFGRGEPLGVRGLSTVLYWYFVTTLTWLSLGYYNPFRLGNHQWPRGFHTALWPACYKISSLRSHPLS